MNEARTTEPVTPIHHMLNVFGWLLLPSRRPGVLGTPSRIEGRRIDGAPATLERVAAGWAFVGEPDPRRFFSDTELIKLMAQEFIPKLLYLRQEFAGEFFAAAVRHEGRAATHCVNAEGHAKEVTGGPGDDIDYIAWVLWAGEVDRAMTEAASVIVLALAAAEAQANSWAEAFGVARTDGRPKKQKPALIEVLRDLALAKGSALDLGRQPFQDLRFAIDRRNEFVHARPLQPVDLTRAPFVPGRSILIDARRSLVAVRRSLVEVSRCLSGDAETVRYLAACPLADPQDDDAWRSAYILTGIRPDPDFPPTLASTEDEAPAHQE